VTLRRIDRIVKPRGQPDRRGIARGWRVPIDGVQYGGQMLDGVVAAMRFAPAVNQLAAEPLVQRPACEQIVR
jgi:hypothetical protein